MRTLVGGSIAVICAVAAACSSEAEDSPSQGPGTDAGSDVNIVGTDAGPNNVIEAQAPGDDVVFTDAERVEMAKHSPLPVVPPDPTNAFADNAGAALLGQQLFFEKSYSGSLTVGDNGANGGLGAVGEVGKVACASCHGGPMMDDQRSKPNNVSLGTDYGPRNALSMVNSSFYKWTNWGGRFDSQWSLPLAVAENARLMKSSRLAVAHMLWTKYRAEYNATFPVALDPALDANAPDAARFPLVGKPKGPGELDGPWEAMAPADQAIVNRIFSNYGKALAAYTRKLVSRNSPFDRFVAGEGGAISANAKRGLKVFLGKGKCALCHSGPNFADDDFHAIAVPQTGANVPAADLGRFTDIAPLLTSPFNTKGAFSDQPTSTKLDGLAQSPSMIGQFRTKSLRGVASAAPFMHGGQHATLEAVVDYYVSGGGSPQDGGTKDPLFVAVALTTEEKADLVAFMKTLDGEPVAPALLVNTAK